MRFVFLLIPVFLLLPPAVFLSAKDGRQQYTLHGYAQGTDYSIKYYAEKPVVVQRLVDSILLQIDSSMSLYKPYSLISRFNASASGLKPDPHFRAVVKRSLEVYKDTRGAFDITVAPLVQLWGFGPEPVKSFPDSAVIKNVLKDVGMNYLELDNEMLRKLNPRVKIDLNGIAQGYSVDQVADYLLNMGVTCFVVEIGGELRMKGRKPDGSLMRVGIEGPAVNNLSEPDIRHVISFTDGAVTTSGNYRKYLQYGAKHISHLIDPKSGYPVENEMISVTLYAKDAITADGYDNAVMGMPIKEALAFVMARKDLEAYFVYHLPDGTITDTLTTGFRKMIVN